MWLTRSSRARRDTKAAKRLLTRLKKQGSMLKRLITDSDLQRVASFTLIAVVMERQAGRFCSAQLAVYNGSGTYTYSLSLSSLPDGLRNCTKA